MAVNIDVTYTGDFQTEITHGPSNAKLNTDLPVDNGGKGRKFSPTDLFVSSFGSCVMTIMAKFAENCNIAFEGTKIELEKIMADNPRRVEEIKAKIIFATELDAKQKKKLLACIQACPVHRSLHPDIKITIIN